MTRLHEPVPVTRQEVSGRELKALGYDSVRDMLRDEDIDPAIGYYAGVEAAEALNVGLTHEARDEFREARKQLVADFYGGKLIAEFSQVSYLAKA